MTAFATEISRQDGVLSGPPRGPKQMLAVQEYDGHTSIHDDATAKKLGFKGGTIEGPTHFSQFAPLGFAMWGNLWLSNGCISAHYRAPVFDGEQVQAFLRAAERTNHGEIWMQRPNAHGGNNTGDEILRGTASVGPDFPQSALERRIAELTPLANPVILADLKVGMRASRTPVRMAADQHMGALYPFSLSQKLKVITESSPLYCTHENAWGRPIVPLEMISVLMQYSSRNNGFATRGPAVGLFADQEIRLLNGPVFVDEPYEVEREIVFLSGSKRTESMWIRSTLYAHGSDRKIAQMMLNLASMKESYEPYARDYEVLYGKSN